MTDLPPPPGDQTQPIHTGPTGAGDPGGYGAAGAGDPAAYGAAGPGDSGAYGATETLQAPPPRSRRGLVIGAGAAVLALVAGAAVYATTALSGGGRQPDEVVPKSTFAYVKVDLDPAANQKLAARSFFGKFPRVKDKTGDTDNVFDDVLAAFLDEEVDYRRDVEPWFDKRAAVASFPGAEGKPHAVTVLRSKDDDKARESLDRLTAQARADGENVTYQLARGYAVVGEQPAVAEAIRQSENESLRDNEFYQGDVDKLEGDQIAVGWVNIAEAFRAAKTRIPFGNLIPGALSSQVKGRLVAGVHLTNDYAELQGFSIGAGSRVVPDLPSSSGILTSLPPDTMGAVLFNGIETGADTAGSLFDLDDLVGQYLQGSGLSFVDDIVPVLGDETVLAVGPGANLTEPRVGLVSKVTKPERARATAAKIAPLLSFFGLDVDADVVGDRFVLATPGEYAATLGGGGGLGEAPRFGKAMGELDGAQFAVYADLGAVRAALLDELEPGLAAFGMVAGQRGEESFVRVRLVAE